MQTLRRASYRRILPALLLGVLFVVLGAAPAPAQEVDITKIFWCFNEEAEGLSGEEQAQLERCIDGRMAILYNCTFCHTFVPIVTLKDETEWDATLQRHDARLPDLVPEERELIRDYLVTMFNPDMPLPELPPELQGFGTDQAF